MGSTCAKDTRNVCDDSNCARSSRYCVGSARTGRRRRDKRPPQAPPASNAGVPPSGLGSYAKESLSSPAGRQRGETPGKGELPPEVEENKPVSERNLSIKGTQSPRMPGTGAKPVQPKYCAIQSPPLDELEAVSNANTNRSNARQPGVHTSNSSCKDDNKETKAESEKDDELKSDEHSDDFSAASATSHSAPYKNFHSVVSHKSSESSPLPLRPTPPFLHQRRVQRKGASVRVALLGHAQETERTWRLAIAEVEEGERCALVEQCVASRQRVLLRFPAVQADTAAAEFGVLATMPVEKEEGVLGVSSGSLLREDEAFARETLNAAEEDEWRVLLDGFVEARKRIQQHLEQLRQQLELHTQAQGWKEWQRQDSWSQSGHVVAFTRRERWLIDGAPTMSSVASTADDSDDARSHLRAPCLLDCAHLPHSDSGPPIAADAPTARGPTTLHTRAAEGGSASAAAPGPRRRVPLRSPTPDVIRPVRGCFVNGAAVSPVRRAGTDPAAADPPQRPRRLHPAAPPSESIATGKWMPPLRVRPPPFGAERSVSSPQPPTPSSIAQSAMSCASSSVLHGGKRICRWCDEPYEWRDVCLVARKPHIEMRQQRKEEKRVKKRAQALLRGGHVQDALSELRLAELI